MKLTDTDRAAISATLKISEPWDAGCAIEGDVVGRLYLAGKRAGREDMRERAAAECDHWQSLSATHKCGACMAGVIRALGVDDDA